MKKFRPYIIIKYRGDEINKAVLKISENRSIDLDVHKITRDINFYTPALYESEQSPNNYILKDWKITKKYFSSYIDRRNKFIGTAVVSSALSLFLLINAKAVFDKEIKRSEDSEVPKYNSEEIIDGPSDDNFTIDDPQVETIGEYIGSEAAVDSFSFDFDDRTDSEQFIHVRDNYSAIANKYASTYGIDPQLILAIITQENPFNKINNSNAGANGIMQIESIWYDHEVTAFNFDIQDYETINVDRNSISDPEYSVKVGSMIFRSYYDIIYKKFVATNILTESEGIVASLVSYNKGVYAIIKLIETYGSDFVNHLEEKRGGDDLYPEHVFSYIEDEQVIYVDNINGERSRVCVDNLQNNISKF